MAKKLSFIAKDENNLTIAETWLERIDRPRMNATPKGSDMSIDRRAVRRMKEAAVDVQEIPEYLYIFADGSGLYEKRKDDWFIGDSETVARAQDSN